MKKSKFNLKNSSTKQLRNTMFNLNNSKQQRVDAKNEFIRRSSENKIQEV